MDAVVCGGGDGIFHEALQGLLHRNDWKEVSKCVSLGILPLGERLERKRNQKKTNKSNEKREERDTEMKETRETQKNEVQKHRKTKCKVKK